MQGQCGFCVCDIFWSQAFNSKLIIWYYAKWQRQMESMWLYIHFYGNVVFFGSYACLSSGNKILLSAAQASNSWIYIETFLHFIIKKTCRCCLCSLASVKKRGFKRRWCYFQSHDQQEKESVPITFKQFHFSLWAHIQYGFLSINHTLLFAFYTGNIIHM